MLTSGVKTTFVSKANMKVFYNNRIPPKGFGAINLFGLIFVRKDYGELTKVELNHERIHTRQMLEMLVLFFYIIYTIEWLVRIVQYRNRIQAYYNISFEREAYENMSNLHYLRKRNFFAFIHYYKSTKS